MQAYHMLNLNLDFHVSLPGPPIKYDSQRTGCFRFKSRVQTTMRMALSAAVEITSGLKVMCVMFSISK